MFERANLGLLKCLGQDVYLIGHICPALSKRKSGCWILRQPVSGDRGSEKPFRVDERSKPAKHTLFASSGDGNLHFGVLQLGSVLCPWQGNPAILVDALIRGAWAQDLHNTTGNRVRQALWGPGSVPLHPQTRGLVFLVGEIASGLGLGAPNYESIR